jgi:hypothetical protein
MRRKHVVGFVEFLIVLILAGGCSHQYRATNLATGQPQAHLDRSRSVLVIVPADGAYGDKVTPGSGYMVAERTKVAFMRYASDVRLADPSLKDRDAQLAAARSEGAGYLAVPTIIVWEPRFTMFTGHRTHVSLQMNVVEVGTGSDISSTALEAYSRKVSISRLTVGGLLPRLIGNHVAVLYGAKPPPVPEEDDGDTGKDDNPDAAKPPS